MKQILPVQAHSQAGARECGGIDGRQCLPYFVSNDSSSPYEMPSSFSATTR